MTHLERLMQFTNGMKAKYLILKRSVTVVTRVHLVAERNIGSFRG